MDQVPLTREGADRLRAELEKLKKVERPNIIAAIADARAHGDLKENAEYHAAREQQSFVEGRIQHLESALSHARVIDTSELKGQGKVVFGAHVTLFDEEAEQEAYWQIVGELEADVEARRLSVTAPLARGLIGREQGDVVEVKAPSGVRSYEILEVSYK